MNRARLLLRVIRPHIVLGGALGYLLGVFFPSNTRLDYVSVILGYLTIFFIDLSTHFSNDLYDAERDKQANWKPFGSKNVLIKTPEIAPWLHGAAITSSVLSLVLAVFLVLSYNVNWLILLLTVIGNILGWCYSHPSVHLKAKGLGETTIAFGTGFIIPATGYIVVTGFLTGGFVSFLAPMVVYGFIMSVFLELPDIEVDKRNNINNLAVRYGYKTMMRVCLFLSALNTLYFLSGSVPVVNRWSLTLVSLFPLAACLKGALGKMDSRKAIEQNTFLVISGLFVFIIGLVIVLSYFS